MELKKMELQKKRNALKPWLLLLLLCGMLAGSCMTTQAASAKTKALKAYASFLSKSTINTLNWHYKASECSFAIAYIDNNSVPELIVYYTNAPSSMEGTGTLYAYQNGKVKAVCVIYEAKKFVYYKKKGAFADYRTNFGVTGVLYQTLKKGKTYRVCDKFLKSIYGPEKYVKYINYNSDNYVSITKKELTSIVKKLTGSAAKSKLKFYKNTKANRSKYLK